MFSIKQLLSQLLTVSLQRQENVQFGILASERVCIEQSSITHDLLLLLSSATLYIQVAGCQSKEL